MTRFDVLRSKIFQKKRRATRRSIDPSLNDSNDHDPGPSLGTKYVLCEWDVCLLYCFWFKIVFSENSPDKKQETDGNPVLPTDHPILPAVTLPPEASQSEGPLADDRPQEASKQVDDSAQCEAAHGNAATPNPASVPNLQNQPASNCKSSSSPSPSPNLNPNPNPTIEFVDRVNQNSHSHIDRPSPCHDEDRPEEQKTEDKGKRREKTPVEYISTGCQVNFPDIDHSPPPPPVRSCHDHPSSCSNSANHNAIQCRAITKAGMRCSISVKIQNDHDHDRDAYIHSNRYCHIHRRTQPGTECNSNSQSNTAPSHEHGTAPSGPSVKIRIDVTHSTTVQCSGMTKKGTRCGKMARPRDSTGLPIAYCHLHLYQQHHQQQQQQQPQGPAVGKDTCQPSCRMSPEPDIKFRASRTSNPCSSRPPSSCSSCSGVRVAVSVQCCGRVKGGQQCRRHVSSIDGVSPAYCFQHASQRARYMY